MRTVEDSRRALSAKTAASLKISEDRTEVLNSGLAANLEMPHPVFIERGEGPYVFDADGNQYIDTSVGFGLHLLGHAHHEISAAIHSRTDKGWMFGIHSTSQLKLAQLIKEASPCAERVVFCNTGSEATMYAFRAARAFSGKEKIALFEGCYHGAHDYGMWVSDPSQPVESPQPLPMGHGIPRNIADLTVMLPYRNPAAFDLIRAQADEIAMVFVEGVQSANPDEGAGEFLRELSDVCQDVGVLFGIDEVITGFRVAYGGAQSRFSVASDIATYGKVIGGGLPAGAIAGRADLMNVFNGLAVDRGIFSGGTFSGNPLTMEAGAAMLGHLKAHQQIYFQLEALTQALAEGVNQFCQQSEIPVQLKHVGSMFHMFFQQEPILSVRDIHNRNREAEKAFYLHCLSDGVLVPGTQRAFLSAAHTQEDVARIERVFCEALADVQCEGFFTPA